MNHIVLIPGQEVACGFCGEDITSENVGSIFCNCVDGVFIKPVICKRCYDISYEMTKDVIDERIMRKGGS